MQSMLIMMEKVVLVVLVVVAMTMMTIDAHDGTSNHQSRVLLTRNQLGQPRSGPRSARQMCFKSEIVDEIARLHEVNQRFGAVLRIC